VIFSLASSMA
jgi:hypothetical protein